jgi:2-C-methyl-D-erythritol 4-phosphate cytidylyltransferase
VIHDAARPLVRRAVLERVLDAIEPDTGAIAAVPVADTLKRVDEDGRITGTVDRRGLWRAQTPQGFPRMMIVGAYERAVSDGVTATDDAALVEHYGGRVRVVEGDTRNLKITWPEDLRRVERILAEDGS